MHKHKSYFWEGGLEVGHIVIYSPANCLFHLIVFSMGFFYFSNTYISVPFVDSMTVL